MAVLKYAAPVVAIAFVVIGLVTHRPLAITAAAWGVAIASAALTAWAWHRTLRPPTVLSDRVVEVDATHLRITLWGRTPLKHEWSRECVRAIETYAEPSGAVGLRVLLDPPANESVPLGLNAPTAEWVAGRASAALAVTPIP